MKFTKTLKETGQTEITSGENKLLWAHGSSDALGYHRSKSQFVLNLSSGLSEEVKIPNMKVWLAHGVMAFLAWGVRLPVSSHITVSIHLPHRITVVQMPPSLQYCRLCSIRCPLLYCSFIHNEGRDAQL